MAIRHIRVDFYCAKTAGVIGIVTGILVSFLFMAGAAGLTVSELMYHPVFSPADPPDTGEALEYIELYNEGPETEDLGGYAFVEGVLYVFPQETLLPPPLVSFGRVQSGRSARFLRRTGR